MKLFRTISSLLLAVLVLMASSSFYVGVHYCGGSVKAVAFLNEADGCGHQQLPPCHRKAMKGCCEDDQIVHERIDFKTVDALSFESIMATPVVHHTIVLAEVIPTANANPTNYFSDHPPALTGHDIIISIQSFLI
ncbi:MAG: hypothetical protein KF846_10560 [Cyclobacteriaceae bacterium]|nr:hypothetical protein [Cyclobacteriaceae bacterium]